MTYATKITNAKTTEYIQNRINFEASNFRGYNYSLGITDYSVIATGRLNSDLVALLHKDEPLYIVYSYGTPIAWYGRYGWHLPAVRYSSTTSRHQSIVRSAIA